MWRPEVTFGCHSSGIVHLVVFLVFETGSLTCLELNELVRPGDLVSEAQRPSSLFLPGTGSIRVHCTMMPDSTQVLTTVWQAHHLVSYLLSPTLFLTPTAVSSGCLERPQTFKRKLAFTFIERWRDQRTMLSNGLHLEQALGISPQGLGFDLRSSQQ